ncbi:TPA: 5'-nucleotidase [Vibrio diabolicus]
MPIDLTETLVVGISATALFDLSEADEIFREKKQNRSKHSDRRISNIYA